MRQQEKDKLAEKNLDIAKQQAKMMHARFGGRVDLDELHSFALIGLAKAIEGFDPQKGVPFRAYAAIRIKGAIYDEVAKLSYLPRRLIRQIAFFQKSDDLLQDSATEPPPSDIVDATHRIANRLKDLATAYVTSYSAGENVSQPGASTNAEHLVEKKQYFQRLNNHIDKLPKRNRKMLKMYYFEDHSLQEIARDQGYSKSWVSRVIQVSLKQLRDSFSSEG